MELHDLLNLLEGSLKQYFIKQTINFPVTFIDEVILVMSQNEKVIDAAFCFKYDFKKISDFEKLSLSTSICCYVFDEKEITQKMPIKEFLDRYAFKEESYMLKKTQDYNLLESPRGEE